LWKVADLIEQHADELAEIETLDNGKPIRASRHGDIPMAVRHFRYYAGWASKIEGATIPVSFHDQFVYTLREPMGVVGLSIPWNFPLLMAAWKLAPALACGNTAILKPADETPLTALRLGELMQAAGFPPGVVNIVTSYGVPAGAAITAHLGIDKVAFTRSTEVGRKVMAAAAGSNLKRVSLELGGKSPNVIFADADIEKAIKGVTWAVFSTAGQECVAGSRLFIEQPVYQQVLDGLAEQAKRIRVGSGFAPKVHIGPIVSERQLMTILGYLDGGRQSGAQIVTGGDRLGGDLANGYFVAPTIFTHRDDALKLVQEEIFGPVVAATSFEAWDELIARANTTRYGLAAGVWTRDVSKAHRFARREGGHGLDQHLRFVRRGCAVRRLQGERLRARDGQRRDRTLHSSEDCVDGAVDITSTLYARRTSWTTSCGSTASGRTVKAVNACRLSIPRLRRRWRRCSTPAAQTSIAPFKRRGPPSTVGAGRARRRASGHVFFGNWLI
jgi:acyl-CoA reductase-like NAD-dependent aldehyde dehydrogenase